MKPPGQGEKEENGKIVKGKKRKNKGEVNGKDKRLKNRKNNKMPDGDYETDKMTKG